MITANEDAVAEKLEHYGGLFIGSHAAEVLGDYGAGPNHTLPTVRPVRGSHFMHCPLTLLAFVCSRREELLATRAVFPSLISCAFALG